MKSKQLLITVYFDEPDTHDNFVVDSNTEDEYDYDKCITKVLRTHFASVNSRDVTIKDVALDTNPDRIRELVGSK